MEIGVSLLRSFFKYPFNMNIMTGHKITITNEILNLISEIDEFKGGWPSLNTLSPQRLEILKKSAIIDSISSSTRIEGIKLQDHQIDNLLNNIHQISFKDSSEEEVVGYFNAMQFIFESYHEIEISERYIKQIHSILLKFNYKNFKRRGDYKKLDNDIIAYDLLGSEIGVVCKTAAPFETQTKMTDLMLWASESFAAKEVHPLIILSIFILRFLIIHPFQDANGRLSRCLINLIMLKLGYKYTIYSSLESIIEDNKDLYCKHLKECQNIIYNENIDIDGWVIFFLRSLKIQKDTLEKKIRNEKSIQNNLSDLHIEIMKILNSNNMLSISDIQAISKANRNTLKVKLRELVAMKKIISIGSGRGARYSIMPNPIFQNNEE